MKTELKSLVLVTDAWPPQIHGVSRTYQETVPALEARGVRVEVIHPYDFKTVPMPTDRNLRLAVPWGLTTRLETLRRTLNMGALHIATEGPLGLTARRWAAKRGVRFTTSYHTRYPEYLHKRLGVPTGWTYPYMRWFHNAAVRTLVPTPGMQRELAENGIAKTVLWTRGAPDFFHPYPPTDLPELAGATRPLIVYFGRMVAEKNLPDLLALPKLGWPGTLLMIGAFADAKTEKHLRALAEGHDVRFVGPREGDALARLVAAADVFVFPSVDDTFGRVQIEALACGVPVAAYNVTGPKDVLKGCPAGVLAAERTPEALMAAAYEALNRDRAAAVPWVRENFPAENMVDGFLAGLEPLLT